MHDLAKIQTPSGLTKLLLIYYQKAFPRQAVHSFGFKKRSVIFLLIFESKDSICILVTIGVVWLVIGLVSEKIEVGSMYICKKMQSGIINMNRSKRTFIHRSAILKRQ